MSNAGAQRKPEKDCCAQICSSIGRYRNGHAPTLMRNLAIGSGASPRAFSRILSALTSLTRMVAPESPIFALCSRRANDDMPEATQAEDKSTSTGGQAKHACVSKMRRNLHSVRCADPRDTPGALLCSTTPLQPSSAQ